VLPFSAEERTQYVQLTMPVTLQPKPTVSQDISFVSARKRKSMRQQMKLYTEWQNSPRKPLTAPRLRNWRGRGKFRIVSMIFTVYLSPKSITHGKGVHLSKNISFPLWIRWPFCASYGRLIVKLNRAPTKRGHTKATLSRLIHRPFRHRLRNVSVYTTSQTAPLFPNNGVRMSTCKISKPAGYYKTNL
jgi:hypothetical protein